AGSAEGEVALFDGLRAGAPVPHHAGIAHIVHDRKDLAIAQYVDRNAVELREVELLDLEALDRSGKALLDVRFGVARHPGKLATPPKLGRHKNILLVLKLADPALAH